MNQHRVLAPQVIRGALPAAPCAAVLKLADQVEHIDGVAALSEAPLLRLQQGDGDHVHLLIHDAGESELLLGYAQLDLSGGVPSAELVVHPAARRRGLGSQLVAQLENLVAELETIVPPRIWAHGDLPAAQALAGNYGYTPVRELLQLGRPLTSIASSSALPSLPKGYRVRRFQPGVDDEAWVRLNALIFADHPEQGRLSVSDLQARMQEPWFSAQDFQLVIAPDGQLAGFCWSKNDHQTGSGEIYAIGVTAPHQRLGLAKYLLETAFAQMSAAGLTQATLYVEGDNDAALAAYYSAGFAPINVDVQYAKSPISISELSVN